MYVHQAYDSTKTERGLAVIPALRPRATPRIGRLEAGEIIFLTMENTTYVLLLLYCYQVPGRREGERHVSTEKKHATSTSSTEGVSPS